MKVPMSSPDITEAERHAVAQVMTTPRLSMGPEVEAFENEFAELLGLQHALAVNSGTTGLHLCVRAVEIQDEDLVLTTPFSFVASSNVILYERAVPVFVDVDPESGTIDPALVANAAEDLRQGGAEAVRWLPKGLPEPKGALKAILAVDVYGQPADYDQLQASADRHELTLIQDSCESLGSEYRGKSCGTQGSLAVFAFYPNKQITTAEGGMVVTKERTWAEKMRALRNQGRAPGDTWLDHTFLGYNYRMDELSAALGRAQLKRLEELIEKRSRVATWYTSRLDEIPGVQSIQVAPYTSRMSWFVFVVRFEEKIDLREVIQRMRSAGIPSRPYFTPIHLQPYMVERFGYRVGDFPLTEDLSQRSLALPFSSVMIEDQVELVCQTLMQVLQSL